MTQITVSDELARQISDAFLPIVFVDSSGRLLGEMTHINSKSEIPKGLSPEDWAEIQRRMREPGEYVTFQEIKNRLGW